MEKYWTLHFYSRRILQVCYAVALDVSLLCWILRAQDGKSSLKPTVWAFPLICHPFQHWGGKRMWFNTESMWCIIVPEKNEFLLDYNRYICEGGWLKSSNQVGSFCLSTAAGHVTYTLDFTHTHIVVCNMKMKGHAVKWFWNIWSLGRDLSRFPLHFSCSNKRRPVVS